MDAASFRIAWQVHACSEPRAWSRLLMATFGSCSPQETGPLEALPLFFVVTSPVFAMWESLLLCVASFAVGCCSSGLKSKRRVKESSRSLAAARKGRRMATSPTSPRSPSKATQATTTTGRSAGSEPEKTGNLWFKAVRTLSGVFNKAFKSSLSLF